MGLKQYISESAINLLLEGKMEDELAAQIINGYAKRNRINPKNLVFNERDHLKKMAKLIIDIDPTPKKSWRFIIKKWWFETNEITLPEDAPKLAQELQLAKKYNITQYDKFKTRHDLYEFLENVKRNRGIVDELFNYTFDIDYADQRFTIYNIQAKDKAEYIEKLGSCTTWCISTEQMFNYYPLPYYLLVDKKEKHQYAIIPSGGQFRDSKQNTENSKKKFEEFDKILDLRRRYYNIKAEGSIIDSYIYAHPYLNDLSDDMLINIIKSDQLYPTYILDNVKNPSEEVLIAIVTKSPSHIKEIDNPSENVQIEAVRTDGAVIRFIKTDHSEGVQLFAILYSIWNFQYIKKPYKTVQMAAVESHGELIRYIDSPEEDVQLAAVKNWAESLKYVKHEQQSEKARLLSVQLSPEAIEILYDPSEEIQLAAVGQEGNGGLIKYCPNPTEKVQIAAVQDTPDVIALLKNPSEAVQLAAVEKSPRVIAFIDSPTEAVQLVAVKRATRAINSIKNPTPKAIALAKELSGQNGT